MKIRELYIEEYKMFKDFKIDFLDNDNKPLDIVVLAGVNGSGKTTLLECLNAQIDNQEISINDVSQNIKEVNIISDMDVFLSRQTDEQFLLNFDNYREISSKDREQIIYLPIYQNNITDLKETIRQKYIDRAFEIDKPSLALFELQEFIANTFSNIDLTFNLSFIDYNKNIVLFKDNYGNEFDIEELSTGEKTLLSKVLYLYYKDYVGKLILIDEPELSLHPSWQNRVLKIYENFAKLNNCQIILATHSPHIIGSAKSESIRLLSKEGNKIEVVDNFSHTYGAKFSQILTDVMGVDYLRVPIVAQKLDEVKAMIAQNSFDSDEFKTKWKELEEMLGKSNLELKLLKLEIASRKKNVSNS